MTPVKASMSKAESLDGMKLMSNRMGDRAEATRTVKKRMSYDQHHGQAGGNRYHVILPVDYRFVLTNIMPELTKACTYLISILSILNHQKNSYP